MVGRYLEGWELVEERRPVFIVTPPDCRELKPHPLTHSRVSTLPPHRPPWKEVIEELSVQHLVRAAELELEKQGVEHRVASPPSIRIGKALIEVEGEPFLVAFVKAEMLVYLPDPPAYGSCSHIVIPSVELDKLVADLVLRWREGLEYKLEGRLLVRPSGRRWLTFSPSSDRRDAEAVARLAGCELGDLEPAEFCAWLVGRIVSGRLYVLDQGGEW